MDGFGIAWWMWFLLGILLLLSEVLSAGAFYALFFGVGAVVVGLLGAFGLELSAAWQMGLFLVLSLGSLALLRGPLRAQFTKGPRHEVDRMEGETAIALGEIAVGEVGKAELRGTIWNAHNVGSAAIAESHRCRVVRMDGLTLEIEG